jgi:hypothetical protein
VIWLNEGLFPSAKSVEQVGGEAEERRLFYVAATRAEDRLFLCSPAVRRKHDGGCIFYEPSVFINEIPAHLLQKDHGGISANRGYSSQEPPYQPKQHSIPFKNTFNTMRDVQIHLEEKERTLSLPIALADISFSAEEASVDLLLNKDDLPGFSRYTHETITMRDPIFQESVNHLKQYLAQCKTLPDITIKLQVRYNQSAVSTVTLLDHNLSTVLRTCIEESKPIATAQCLAELAEKDVVFVDSDKLISGSLACFDMRTDNDIIDALITRRSEQKHAKQIAYLAPKHCYQYGKLRIGTDNSLLCILKGTSNLFFVWEMFDENYATYLWKQELPHDNALKDPGSIQHEINKVEEQIGIIKTKGRLAYRKENIPNFSFIDHVYGTDGIADFSAWKEKLNGILSA